MLALSLSPVAPAAVIIGIDAAAPAALATATATTGAIAESGITREALEAFVEGVGVGIDIAISSQQEDDDSPFIYRKGPATDDNFTPRPGQDDGGWSAFDTPARATQGAPNTKYQIIDTRKLVELEAHFDDNPPGY